MIINGNKGAVRMPKNMKVYDLLISCPSDVNEYVEIIEECISSFNRNYGEINNTLISVKHWKSDSYPESGNKPQELLNKQFVLESDAAVALFWTKFGTPTDKYGSGTEEEIEELLKQGKQVFMYFLNAPVLPDSLDSNQYQKVKDFKIKYQDKGIYSIISDEDDFKRQFTNHIALHFMKIITTNDDVTAKSVLRVEDSLSPEQEITAKNLEFRNSVFMARQSEKIREKILSIGEIVLPELEGKDSPVDINNPLEKKLGINNLESIVGSGEPVKISEDWRRVIHSAAEICDIKLGKKFFEVGSLTRTRRIHYNFTGGSRYNYDGKDSEKKKFNAIKTLYMDARVILDYTEYFSKLDDLSFISLAVVNEGQTFDEDIDLTLYFEKDTLMLPEYFPIPGESIIETVNEEEFLQSLLMSVSSEKTIEYDNYPIPRYIPTNIGMLAYSKNYDEFKSEYINDLKQMMCYEVFEKKDVDIIRFKVQYIKQHTKMVFPSKLFLRKTDTTIRYNISSKFSPLILEGEIEIQ